MPLIAPLKQNTGIFREPRVNSSEHLQNRRFANLPVVRVSHTDKQVHKSASLIKFSPMITPASESSMQPPQPDSSPFSNPIPSLLSYTYFLYIIKYVLLYILHTKVLV